MANRLAQARGRFERRIDGSADHVARCIAARHATQARNAFTADQIEWSYEIAFLKMFAASEEFFEVAMGLYAIGERAPSGFRPRRRRNVRVSLPQVLEMFKGDQNFVGWNEPDPIIKRAEGWFRNGEPFQTALGGASQLLGYLKRARNVIAHDSDDAYERFARATRTYYGSVPRILTPGRVLAGTLPTGIAGLSGSTLFEASVNTFRAVAAQVVPA